MALINADNPRIMLIGGGSLSLLELESHMLDKLLMGGNVPQLVEKQYVNARRDSVNSAQDAVEYIFASITIPGGLLLENSSLIVLMDFKNRKSNV